MKAKHLLTGLVLPTVFAACTSEEIVSQQDVVKSDLSNRPVVGKVELNLGGMESRGTVGDPYFNSIAFVEGEDGFGARIIDTYSPISLAGDKVLDHAVRNYTIVDEYASSNYKYVNNGGKSWVTDALMVEGNYMFYYPYNEANLARTPNKVVLPKAQVVKPNEEDGYRNPIKDLYEGENPAIVGYTFLKATDQEATVSPALHHVFAYPQITLTNDYTYNHDNDTETDEIGKEMTVTKIVLTHDNFIENGTINHKKLVAELRDFSVDAIEDYGWEAIEKGSWNNNTKDGAYDALTSEIATWTKKDGEVTSIEITFDGGLTLSPEESYSFNFVAPAANLKGMTMKVCFADDKMFDTKLVFAQDITFATSKRYPTEEYNFPTNGTPGVKESAGDLATIKFSTLGTLEKTVEDAEWINDIEEFEAFLKTIKDNTVTVKEASDLTKVGTGENCDGDFALSRNTNGVAELKIDAEVAELIKKYLASGTIEFYSKIQVKDTEEAVTLNNMVFNGGLDILDGEVVAQKAILADGKQVTVKGGTLTIPNNSESVLENVVVEGGELVANKVVFDLATASKNTTAETTGKITLNKDCGAVNGNKVALAGGEIEISAEAQMNVGTSVNTWTDVTGTLTVNGVLKVNSDFSIAKNVVMNNNGEVTIKEGKNLTNLGTINNYKNLTVTNNGTVNMIAETANLVANGVGGHIYNTELAYVKVNNADRDAQTVWYVYEEDVDVAAADAVDYLTYAINALEIKGKKFTLNVEESYWTPGNFNEKGLAWISTVKLTDGSSVYAKLSQSVGMKKFFVEGTVTMDGWGMDNESSITFLEAASIEMANGSKLVVNGITLKETTSKEVSFTVPADATATYSAKIDNNGDITAINVSAGIVVE